MANSTKKSEIASLEAYRVALENVGSQEQIASQMLEMGYDDALLAEGRALLKETQEKYQMNKKEDAEQSEAYERFAKLWGEMDAAYRLHRKKAKVISRNEPGMLEKLAAVKSVPSSYVKWVQIMRSFYGELSADEALQQKVSRLKLRPEEIQTALERIELLEKARAEYLKEKGESQNATQIKEEAFARLDNWMSEFYSVARIALDDSPQLLEALGKQVRN